MRRPDITGNIFRAIKLAVFISPGRNVLKLISSKKSIILNHIKIAAVAKRLNICANGEVVMKRKAAVLFAAILSLPVCLVAAAKEAVPTGERINILPYILAAVALVLIVALAWLTYLSKKKK